MALPSSGQLTLAQIRDEFGPGTTSDVNLRTLSAAAGLSVPDGFNEFYGLASYTPPSYVSGGSSVTGAGTAANPYYVTINTFNNFTSGEEYADCGSLGYSEMVSWVGRNTLASRPVFRFNQSGVQRATLQVTSFVTNMCSNGGLYSYATIQLGSYMVNANFYEFSQGNKYFGDNQSAKDKMLNKVYTANSYSSVNSSSTIDIYFQTQQASAIEYDGDCDGYYEEVIYSNCANLTVSSIVVKIYFEPV